MCGSIQTYMEEAADGHTHVYAYSWFHLTSNLAWTWSACVECEVCAVSGTNHTRFSFYALTMHACSAEPGRTTAYSTDIGWRVVWQRLGMEYTYEQIGRWLQIAPSTAHRIFSRFKSTGDIAPREQPSRECLWKLDHHHELLIMAIACENPWMKYANWYMRPHQWLFLGAQSVRRFGGWAIQGKKSSR